MKTKHFLLCCLVVLCSVSAFPHDFEVDGIYYCILGGKSVCVVGEDGTPNGGYSNSYWGNVCIPSEVNFDGVVYRVEEIGSSAFWMCPDLISITIPNTIKRIGSTFDGCTGLSKTNYTGDLSSWCAIDFADENANPIHYSHNFYIDDVKVEDLIIPNGVDTIKPYVFYGCSSLTSVTIPQTVTMIGSNSFAETYNIESIVVEDGNMHYHSDNNCIIKTASKELVAGCYNSIIPADGSVQKIGDWAFLGCLRLTSITLPNSIQMIGNRSFSGCLCLASITCLTITPPMIWSSSTFSGVDHSVPVYVLEESVMAYKEAAYWKDFMNIQAVNADGVDNIRLNAPNVTRKVFKNGTLYLLRNGEKYTIDGRKVE